MLERRDRDQIEIDFKRGKDTQEICILDISQTILEQGYFTMVLLVDISACTVSFPEIADKLDAYGTERGLAVRIQREDIFNAMHRI